MTSPRRRIFVVDDDPAYCELVREVLHGADYDVETATSGHDAFVRMASGQRPDLILLDLLMPEMDGFEFLEELRRNRAFASTPVIVLTAKDLSEDDRRRLHGSVERILVKRAGSDTLRATAEVLRNMLSKRGAPPGGTP